jgi:hypothetical protein
MFKLSNDNKILLLILFVGCIVYLLSGSNNTEPMHNEGMLTQDPRVSNNFNDVVDMDLNNDNVSNSGNSSNSANSTSSESNASTNSSSELNNKEYKYSSYKKGNRNAKSDSLDQFFEGNSPKKSDNNTFQPSIENDGKYAAYTSGNQNKLTDKEKFDPNSLLPREKNTEWFDDPFEQTTVKSSHLINIYRPMGVGSIQTTRARSHDIRGVPANSKYPISPFNNSSWEADNNINGQQLCA